MAATNKHRDYLEKRKREIEVELAKLQPLRDELEEIEMLLHASSLRTPQRDASARGG